MSERNIFSVTTNQSKGVDVVQTQKWDTVWNNPPAIDFGQIIGNLKLVDYFSVLSKKKMRKCLFACFGTQQYVLTIGKSLPSFHFWVHTTFQQHRKKVFLNTLWVILSRQGAQGQKKMVSLCAVLLPPFLSSLSHIQAQAFSSTDSSGLGPQLCVRDAFQHTFGFNILKSWLSNLYDGWGFL